MCGVSTIILFDIYDSRSGCLTNQMLQTFTVTNMAANIEKTVPGAKWKIKNEDLWNYGYNTNAV